MSNLENEEIDHLIEILMAFKNNIPVEYRWKNFDNPSWKIASEFHVIDFNCYYYRVKIIN